MRRKQRSARRVAQPKKVERKPAETKYKFETLKRSEEFSGHSDALSAIFDSQDLVTKSQVRKALKEHLEREV